VLVSGARVLADVHEQLDPGPAKELYELQQLVV
jgi:hypothetical protein